MHARHKVQRGNNRYTQFWEHLDPSATAAACVSREVGLPYLWEGDPGLRQGAFVQFLIPFGLQGGGWSAELEGGERHTVQQLSPGREKPDQSQSQSWVYWS